MRRLALVVVSAVALSCAAQAPPTRSATRAPPPARFDRARPDGALIEALAALPEGGPVLDALSAAARSDLSAALAAMSPPARAALAEGKNDAAEKHPLLFLAAGGVSPIALRALACRGGTTRELSPLRPPGTPREDLPSVARRVARAAALAYARAVVTKARAGGAVGATEADAVADIARTLADPKLAHAALAYAHAIAPTDARRFALALAAAEDLDLPTAKELVRNEEAMAIPDLARAMFASDRFVTAGGMDLRGPEALDSAEAAAQLGRFDLLPELAAHAGVPAERDLRAGVIFALSRLEGSTCMALERSREPSELCPVAWRVHPELADVQRVLAAAWASGKGRTPWSVEAYAGLAHVVPLSYGGGAGDDGERSLFAHLDALHEALLDAHGPPPPRGTSLALLVEVLAATSRSAAASGGRPSVALATAAGIRERARALAAANPLDAGARRAAIAVGMALITSGDPSELVAAIPEEGATRLERARLAAVVAQRYRHDGLMAEASKALAGAPAGSEDALFRAELGASSTGAGVAPALAALVSFPAAPRFATRMRAAVDRVGALARQGSRAEAERAFAEEAKELATLAPDAASRDLVAAFESAGATLLAEQTDRDARLRAAKRLREALARDGAPPELRLYQAKVLRPLVDVDERESCAKDARCLDAVKAELASVDAAIAAATGAMTAESIRLAEAGFLAGTGSARTSLRYGIATGIELTMETEPVVLVMPEVPGRRAKQHR